MDATPEILAARAKLFARNKGTAMAGGVRRTQNKSTRSSTGGDKALQVAIKKMNCNQIQGIEEVNLFKQDGTVIHFDHPKVQASIQANTYVISGQSECKTLQELLPGIISHLGQDSIKNLKQIADSMKMHAGAEDDDEMPELTENFDTEE